MVFAVELRSGLGEGRGVTHPKGIGLARLNAAVLLAALAAGCASDRISVVPAPADLGAKSGKRICIVENPNVAVRDFVLAYRTALERRGYFVEIFQKNPQVSVCQLTSRYVAYANGFAQLELYWEGRPVGNGFHSSAALSNEALDTLVSRLLP